MKEETVRLAFEYKGLRFAYEKVSKSIPETIPKAKERKLLDPPQTERGAIINAYA